jgi:hypothetical protein
LKNRITLRSSRTGKAASSMIAISSPGLSTVTSEPGIAALILSLRRDSPAFDAVRQLYELTLRIVRPYVGPNPNAPDLEDQVEDLITITLEVVYSGGLTEPNELAQFIETLARHWNRTPIEMRRFGPSVASSLKRGRQIPFAVAKG